MNEKENDQWKTATPERLLAGGYFRSLEGIVLGNLSAIWSLIILPRLVPYPQIFGIISTVGVLLGLIGTILDWGIWTCLDVVLAKAVGANDQTTIEKYVRTTVTFKLYSSIIFNFIIYIFLWLFFPKLEWDWKTIYFFFILLSGTRSLCGFAVVLERSVIAAHRFDYIFYYNLCNFGITVASKLLWFWIFNTYIYPADPILANGIAIAISDTIETFLHWIVHGLVVMKLNIMPLKRVLKPGLDKDVLSHFFHYGKFVTARQYLLFCSEVNSFLWILFVRLNNPNPEIMIGFWVLAIGSMGSFYTASNLTLPIFPSIAEAYHKKEFGLIQKYWITAIKWFLFWGFFSVGLYLGWGSLIVRVLSGEPWYLAGIIAVYIAPAFFFKIGNDYYVNILNAIEKPRFVLYGTLIKIPVLILGGIFYFNDIFSMAIVFCLMEIIFFLFQSLVVHHFLKVSTPRWIIIIPALTGVITYFLTKFFLWLYHLPIGWIQFFILFFSYIVIFFAFFLWFGGMEKSDFVMFETSLKMVFPKGNFAHFFIQLLQKVAKMSPLYGRFETKELNNCKDSK